MLVNCDMRSLAGAVALASRGYAVPSFFAPDDIGILIFLRCLLVNQHG